MPTPETERVEAGDTQESQPVQPHNENASPTAAFKPFGTIALFNYLTTQSERVDWCREIMRVFLQRSREYRYQLTAQEVLDAVRLSFDPNYTLEACKGDLERLVGWSNLTTLHDTSRVTSIADFRSPILLYQATSEAIEIEAFLAEHARIGASEGGLHQGDLPHLWGALQQLDEWLQEDSRTLTPERRLEISERWRDAFTTWENVTNDAAQYLGSMNRSAQQTVNIETYLTYKNIVVTYVHSFAQQLVQFSNRIRALLDDWEQGDKRARLIEILAASPPPTQQLAESPQSRQLWREDVQRQMDALYYWFARGNNVEMFRKAAHDAVEKVVHRAHSLAAAMRPHTDYVTMVQNLANQLLHVEELGTAQDLFASAFASSLPIHLGEGLTGPPSAADSEILHERKTWQAAPTVIRSLRPIAKANLERSVEQPMRADEEKLRALLAEHEAQLLAQQQRFNKLFQFPLLDLGTLEDTSPAERALLTEIIDSCLCNNALEYTTPDGTIITLLNRDEQEYVFLAASDGLLVLPRYRLQRTQPVRVELAGVRR